MPWLQLPSRNLATFYRISIPDGSESVDPTLNDQWNAGEGVKIDASKPTLLCIHILVTDSRIFRFQFSDSRLYQNFNIVALDLRGHGYSKGVEEGTTGREEPYSKWLPDNHAEDVIAFMDALEISSAFIMGNALGASVAIHMAIDHPSRIHGLILIGLPALDGDSPELVAESKAVTNACFEERQEPGEAFDALIGISFPDSADCPYLPGEFRAHCYRMYKDSEFPFLYSRDSYLDRKILSKEDVEKITCPVMITQGDEDDVAGILKKNPMEKATEWMSKARNAPVPIIKIPNAALSVLNRPQFNRMVYQFINEFSLSSSSS